MRAEGELTRGTTNPNRLRRVDRWITGTRLLPAGRPLVVDVGFGASPVTTVELYRAVRSVRPGAEVIGLEIERDRVAAASCYAQTLGLPGLSFGYGGFELPVPRPPALVRAFNVLRQYREDQVPAAWARMRAGLAEDGVLIEGTCDELGRRAVWVTLPPRDPRPDLGSRPALGSGLITFAARLGSLDRPSDLAERLPKALIHRNVPGEPVHKFLTDFDRAWATAAPHSVFGLRQRWLAAVSALAGAWPVIRQPPYGGPSRWRLGEVTLPWPALGPG